MGVTRYFMHDADEAEGVVHELGAHDFWFLMDFERVAIDVQVTPKPGDGEGAVVNGVRYYLLDGSGFRSCAYGEMAYESPIDIGPMDKL